MEQVHINPIENCVNSHIVPIIPDWLDNKTFTSEEIITSSIPNKYKKKYLSEVIAVEALIAAAMPVKQLVSPTLVSHPNDSSRTIEFTTTIETDNSGKPIVILIKAPMGCGKTEVIRKLLVSYKEQNQPVGLMLIYKKNMVDIIEAADSQREFSIQLLTPKEILESVDSDFHKNRTLYTYVKIFFDLYSEHILEELKEQMSSEELSKFISENSDKNKIIDAYLANRIILCDESDFLINIIRAYAASFVETATFTRSDRIKILLEAARQFYADISKKCKALVLLTATTTTEFMKILPESTQVIDPTVFLAEDEIFHSISIKKITYVPYVEWRYTRGHGFRLTDVVIDNIIRREKAAKNLMFVPHVDKQDAVVVGSNNISVIIAPINKVSQEFINSANITPEVKAEIERVNGFNNKHNKENKKNGSKQKNRKTFNVKCIITNDPGEMAKVPGLPDLFQALTDTSIEPYVVIIITGSNCRASNLLTPYDKVVVITDAPLNAEVIQALGRFRNAMIYAYILVSMNSNLSYDEKGFVIHKRKNEKDSHRTKVDKKDEIKKSELERSTNGGWIANSKLIREKWESIEFPNGKDTTEEERIRSLVNVIEDFDFTLTSSMTEWEIGVDYTYCSKDFDKTAKKVDKDIQVRSKSTVDKKLGKALEVIRAFNSESNTEIIRIYKELYPDESYGKNTITAHRKVYNNIINAITENPNLSDREICSFLKENYNYNFESAFIKTYRPK